jgi:hypothetical protein
VDGSGVSTRVTVGVPKDDGSHQIGVPPKSQLNETWGMENCQVPELPSSMPVVAKDRVNCPDCLGPSVVW